MINDFEQQLKNRKNTDDRHVSEAFDALSMAVFGKTHRDSFDKNYGIRSAVEQIAAYYGKKAVLSEEIEDTEAQLDFSMGSLGIMHRTVILEDKWFRDCVFPMLAKRKDTEDYVALIPKNNRYSYYDSEKGKKVFVNSRNCSLFDADAICFYKPFPEGKMSFMELMKFSVSFVTVRDIIMVAVMLLAAAFVGMLLPSLSNMLLSVVVPNQNTSMLMAIVVFMVAAVISQSVFSLLKSLYTAAIVQKVILNVNAAAMIKIFSAPVSFFSPYSSGEMSQRVQCIGNVSGQGMMIFFDSLLSALFSLVYITQILRFAPSLLLPGMIIIIVNLVCDFSSAFIIMGRMRKAVQIEAREQGVTYSIISGIQKIKVSGAEKRVFARWANLLAQSASLRYRPLFVSAVSIAAGGIGLIAIYFISVKDGIPASDYYAFNSAYAYVSAAFSAMAGVGVALAQIKPSFELAQPVFDVKTEITDGHIVITHLDGKIELNNVTFRYGDNAANVFERLSLSIEPGQYVAVVGRTGCGKSTLVRLLLGFEEPLAGTVSYDGNTLNSVDIKSLRRRIGAVLQNGRLFQGTIFSNIVVGQPDLTEEDVWRAVEMADIADDIRKMPMGLSTMLAEGGAGISGGQRQRLMIARAIVSRPGVLIFDEATSALDNISQKKISRSLEQLKCTRVVVAHRLSTVKNCDRILVIDNGHIAEDGTYEELIALNGVFADLLERQRLDV